MPRYERGLDAAEDCRVEDGSPPLEDPAQNEVGTKSQGL